jgi:nucleoside-diphosphate-sugar epimerase
MTRNIAITAVDGHTGSLIAELILTDGTFRRRVSSVTGLALDTESQHCDDLRNLGANIVPYNPGKGFKQAVTALKDAKIDAICLIPPAQKDKLDISLELIEVAKQANVPNICLLSSAGCDIAERDKQPRLREFIDIEAHVMATKGDTSTSTGHSPVIIR